MEEQNNIKKTMNERWLDSVLDSLNNIESYQKLSKHSCLNLSEYVEEGLYLQEAMKHPNLQMIQAKNIEFWNNELKNLLYKIKNYLGLEKYDELITIIKKVDSLIQISLQEESWDMRKSDNPKLISITLKPEFYYCENLLSLVSQKVYDYLWDLLKPTAHTSNEKSKESF